MKLIQAKCQNCHADLEIDLDNFQAKCPYCGGSYIIDSNQIGYAVAEKHKAISHMFGEKEKTKRYAMLQQTEIEKSKNEWMKEHGETLILLIFSLLLVLILFGMWAISHFTK